MAFEELEPRVPTAIGELRIMLINVPLITLPGGEEQGPTQQIAFKVNVLDAQGNVMRNLHGNLAPHLTQAQIDQLKAFLDAMIAKAEQELLP